MEHPQAEKTLVVIVGPTGSGKTDLAIEVARHFGTEILSTDSRQFYKGMPIGTAQPSAEQLATVRHHFIADRLPEQELSAGGYEREALERLGELFEHHDMVVAVGGSGLYIDALCYGFDELPSDTAHIRAELMQRLDSEGLDTLVEELRSRDEAYWQVVDRHNPARVIRALEVCIASGRPYSKQRTATRRSRPFRTVKIGLLWPREELYDRINRRVDIMVGEGLEEEARSVSHLRHLSSLQTVGYREFFDHFDGKITREEAIDLVKRNSRRYAKRQMTWFRRDESIHWIDRCNAQEAIEVVEKALE
ncbi:MAG: tRNA (adenosine(37)-N6)-dimethylallyltransferase MiaA [Rikenellaceae bacterium]|nr:tRNA (adenosine(37)-N6)-dimethylallyltransferase MiaA [Rikenellaceae bacterium]